MIKLAIIGTSGRNPQDANRLELKHLQWMKDNVKVYIENVICKPMNNIILVSGGSAWADHVAVQLFREGGFAGLELYLPSEFNTKAHKYKNTHEGRMLNTLHEQCQNKTGLPIFEDLTSVNSKKNNVKIMIQRGFKPRNTLVARNCDHLVAFTFGNTIPSSGGTSDTWGKVQHENKLHISLDDI